MRERAFLQAGKPAVSAGELFRFAATPAEGSSLSNLDFGVAGVGGR